MNDKISKQTGILYFSPQPILQGKSVMQLAWKWGQMHPVDLFLIMWFKI
jgi:hypothetical protein